MNETWSSKKAKTEIKVDQPIAVLADAYTQSVSLVDVYVSAILDKKETSKLIKTLTVELPLNNLLHLKRVRSLSKDSPLQVVVCSKSEADANQELLSSISERFPALGKTFVVQVPENPPLTRQQYEESIKYWPVGFHEDKRIVSLLSGHHFGQSDLTRMYDHMKTACLQAKIADNKSQIPIGAVIVDPASNTEIAVAHDMRKGENSLHHAVMVAIDLVAHGQSGGMWDVHDDMSYEQSIESKKEEGVKTGPYLSTGYDLYTNTEPCIMCAMALVHSRISRVFYGTSHPEGALGSKYKLHVQTGLNHHYQVFKGLVLNKCDALTESIHKS